MENIEITFKDDFFFGVSNAAGQVEDSLEDAWIDFGNSGRIPGFKDTPFAQDRLRFWSNSETELDLAQDLGVEVFRLSFDWNRLCPGPGVWNEQAAAHYLFILDEIHKRGMKVMATLFHHGAPVWFASKRGWVAKESREHFKFYSEKAFITFASKVEYWITLNEPVPWSYLTYVEGIFPPGKKGTILAHQKALKNMAYAHNEFYRFAHRKDKPNIGIAHHMGFHTGRGFFNRQLSKLTDHLAHWSFLKSISGHMDFFGINYYGAEWMTLAGPAQYRDHEYSDAGRAVSPKGLLILLRRIHKAFPKLPILITENGVGDTTDWLRPAYLMEHLAALAQAIKEGIPVKGYIHWTLSDNLEWSDGYGPKFGLVAVDRKANLKRYPRPSFKLYKKIIAQRGFTRQEREDAWKWYRSKLGLGRPYWRAKDNKSALEKPLMRPTPDHDWRV